MRNLLTLLAAGCIFACSTPKKEEAATTAPAKPAPTEIGDSTYVNTCKAGLVALVGGDVDGFTSNIADNAVFYWNAGDSLAGKAAIVAYWKDRRGNVIDKMEIKNQVWLSLKVNESKEVQTGNWVFAWFKISASYKGGKSMSQWIHNVYHFGPSGQVDQVTQFLDRAPIAAAMPHKK